MTCGADVNISNNKKQHPLQIVKELCPQFERILNLTSLQRKERTEILFKQLNILILINFLIVRYNRAYRQGRGHYTF